MTVKIAIIGSGFGLYGLLPAFDSIKDCNVVSICGKNSKRMENVCKKYNLNMYENWKKMIKKEKPDAIAVAVIPENQHNIVKIALENNIAVFAEKPLTTSFQNSLELFRIATKKKLPNMVDFLFPEISEWKEAKKKIDEKDIGKITSVNVNWSFLSYDLKNEINSWKTNVSQGGGALSFYFSHVFYYLEFFLGKIKKLECNLLQSGKKINDGETDVKMKIIFENGCNGTIHLDIRNEGKQNHSLEFFSKEGSMTLFNSGEDFFNDFQLKFNLKNKETFFKKLRKDQKNNTEDSRVKFVKLIAERFIRWCDSGVSSYPNFQNGLRVQELIDMARTSNKKH
jgi:predicted dehydrogenase